MCYCYCFSYKSNLTREWHALNSASGCSCATGGGGVDPDPPCTPTAGTCASGDVSAASSCPAGVLSQYTTTNATCGGSNITCYKCNLDDNDTCSRANLDENNSPDCRYSLSRDDDQCLNFPSATPTPAANNLCATAPNQDDYSKCVLTTDVNNVTTISCSSISSSNPFVFLQGNSSSDGDSCFRPLACAEVNPQYTTANYCSSSEIPIPVANFCDGDAFFYGLTSQCVICRKVHNPWFQVVNGNIYARGAIQGNNTDLSNLQVMRGTDETCATDSANLSEVGIPLAGDKVINISSQNNPTTAADLTNGFASINPEDYRFFTRNLGFLPEELEENLKACSDLNSDNINDYTFKDSLVCFINAPSGGTAKLSNYLATKASDPNPILTISAGMKKVVFVDGDIELDREIVINQPENQENSSLFLLIASGDIIISPYLGEFVNTSNSGNCVNQAPSLHGIFVTDGTIKFTSDPSLQNTTVLRHCDKKITVKGSFIGWGKNDVKKGISMTRTFAGCLPGSTEDGSSLPYTNPDADYNATTPVITFVYDPTLPHNLPNWVKKSVWVRFETN